jgi:hypothetical protein
MVNIPAVESKIETEVGFIKAHWTSVSLVLVILSAAMLVLGFYIGHKL